MFEIVTTADGSSSVYSTILHEQYHSAHGAIQESVHVFINAGLYSKIPGVNEIDILEIGFGTGLNALLTSLEADKHQKKIKYTTVEKFPLTQQIHHQLNYCSFIHDERCNEIYERLYNCEWEKQHSITTCFQLQKLNMNIEDISFADQFDVIYFDAFSPTSQPELWTAGIFQLMFTALKNEGILVTYCAKGEVKRTLKNIGFNVETLNGPKGKREMIRASKK